MVQPLISIIMPTYNRPVELLDRAVQSVLMQSYKNVELVIVDDNATEQTKECRDNNSEYFDDLKKIDSRVVVLFNEKNLGGALSRNRGIDICKGEYVTFLDDDDLFLVDKVKHQVDYMLENNLNCSFTDLSIYNGDDILMDRRTRTDIKSFDKKSLMKYHLTKVISGTETFMVSRQVLKDIGGFNNAIMGQEFYLMYKILNYPYLKIGYFRSDDIKAYRTYLPAISNGPNKIKGEMIIYNFKKSHFNMLNYNEKLYIKFRHRMIMAISYKRNKRYFKSVCYCVWSFFTSPILCIKEFNNFVKRLHRKDVLNNNL